jgi:hypothetical protein
METGVRRDAARSGPKVQGTGEENGRLKRLVTDLTLDNAILKEMARRTSEPVTEAQGGEGFIIFNKLFSRVNSRILTGDVAVAQRAQDCFRLRRRCPGFCREDSFFLVAAVA